MARVIANLSNANRLQLFWSTCAMKAARSYSIAACFTSSGTGTGTSLGLSLTKKRSAGRCCLSTTNSNQLPCKAYTSRTVGITASTSNSIQCMMIDSNTGIPILPQAKPMQYRIGPITTASARSCACTYEIMQKRTYSSTSSSNGNLKLDHLDIHDIDKNGVATMLMNKPPVNSLNLELLTEFNIALDKLHAEDCRGLILGSATPNIFSAGLEITEMYQPDEARLREFWRALQDVFIKLYGSKMITIAAITGHSPAGGCLLTMCCDYRVMAKDKYTIGLNETLLGIVAPFWFKDAMLNTVGHRETELALQLGKLYTAEGAKSVHLVDEVVPLEDVLPSATQQMNNWLKIPDYARQLSKSLLRQPVLDKLIARKDEDVDNFTKFITMESIQNNLGAYLAALKKKSKK